MIDGDDYAKKFGGTGGTDPDWFKVTIAGISAEGDTTGTIDYYLADFRSENSSEDYIVDNWQWIDISELGTIAKLHFSLSSSDNGDWGMNTPAYFCIDQLNHQDLAPIVKNPIDTIEIADASSKDFYVSLDSVFSDPDNPDNEMTLKIEYIDNTDLLTGTVVLGGKPGEEETLLSLNFSPGVSGFANITVSATSNGKTVYHTFTVISLPVSSEWIAEKDLKIYPNPVHSSFFAELPENANQIMLFSSSGELLYQKIVTGNNRIKVNELQNSRSGIYFLKIKTGDTFISKKIVKW